MSKIRVGEIDVHVQRLPPVIQPPAGEEAPIVVLIHGLLYDSLASFYFTLGPAFANAGMDVIMYDLRGHGKSSRPATGYLLEDFVHDLDLTLGVLGVDRPVHLIGNCFGATVAYGYAASRPDRVASIVAIEGTPPVPLWAEMLGDTLADAKVNLASEEYIANLSAEHGSHMARLTKAAGRILQVTALAEELVRSKTIDHYLGDIKCPVFALFGEDSPMAIQREHMEKYLERGRVTMLPDQGHSVLVERTEEITALISDWVAEHSLVEAE
ncbi:alpha/beta fold hydrolase [Amycolatopsis sp. cg5]|uniref:alpha/beta fold hydrolase n=1 Tax=Amycolatopsis sp. cg5 TaxID=3238802 RepID=UPI0035246DEF